MISAAPNAILLDAGPLYAFYDRGDARHADSIPLLSRFSGRIFTTWPVVTEAAWLLRRDPLGIDKLFESLEKGAFRIASIDREAMPWIRSFLRRYADLPAQLADASLVYLAQRHGVRRVFTFDRRDFSVYRLDDGSALEILPAP